MVAYIQNIKYFERQHIAPVLNKVSTWHVKNADRKLLDEKWLCNIWVRNPVHTDWMFGDKGWPERYQSVLSLLETRPIKQWNCFHFFFHSREGISSLKTRLLKWTLVQLIRWSLQEITPLLMKENLMCDLRSRMSRQKAINKTLLTRNVTLLSLRDWNAFWILS